VTAAQRLGMPSGGASFVTVVQTADFREGDHVTLGDAMNASRRWRVSVSNSLPGGEGTGPRSRQWEIRWTGPATVVRVD
jgi:hypothetical protein